MTFVTAELVETVAQRLYRQERLRNGYEPSHFPWENAGSRQTRFRDDARDILGVIDTATRTASKAALKTKAEASPLFVTTVTREHDDIDTHAATTEAEALNWLRGALYLDTEGVTSPSDPTPPFKTMQIHAHRVGWEITLDRQFTAAAHA